jgi:DNA polymerase III subunit alpha
LDLFGPRIALLEALDRIISVSSTNYRAAEAGQMSLFGALAGVIDEIMLPKSTSEISRREVLNWERELIGLYVSDHPLSSVINELTHAVTHFSGQLSEANPNEKVRVAGIISRIRHHQSKAGKPMGFVTLEDLQGNIELVIFPRIWEKMAEIVVENNIVLVEGRADLEGAEPKVIVDNITTEFSMITSVDSGQPAGEKNMPRLEGKSISAHLDSQPEKGSFPTDPKPGSVSLPGARQLPSDKHHINPIIDISPIGEEDYMPWDADVPALPPDWDLLDQEGVEIQGPPSVPTITHALSNPTQIEQEPNKDRAPEQQAQIVRVEEEQVLPADDQKQIAFDPLVDAQPLEIVKLPKPKVERPPILPPFLVPPVPASEENGDVHMVTVVLRSTGDKMRDVLRLRRIHGIVTSYPGRDRFAFQIYERGRGYLLEFPNSTAGYCVELLGRLAALVGSDNVRVDKITFH